MTLPSRSPICSPKLGTLGKIPTKPIWPHYVNVHFATDQIIYTHKIYNYPVDKINLGGGFKQNKEDLENLKIIIDDVTKKYKVIAEPGRFFSENTQYLVCKIMEVKIDKSSNKQLCYFNDSIYHNFSSVIFDKMIFNNQFYINSTLYDKNKYLPSVIYGRTCDGMDRIEKDVLLPEFQIS